LLNLNGDGCMKSKTAAPWNFWTIYLESDLNVNCV
jgi:hypothetical protein